MYKQRSRLSLRQQSELITLFVAGATARTAGELVGVHRNTAVSYFMRLRRLIATHLPSYRLVGEVEAVFLGVRKGKRGRGAAGKIVVFGLLKRSGKVYTAIIPDARTETLMPITKEQVEPDSIVYIDAFKVYNALDVSCFHHHRINHNRLFAKRGYINGIENFWNQAKRHLRRFNGIKPEHFYWFLKEYEWRFNGGNHNELLTQLKYWVKESEH